MRLGQYDTVRYLIGLTGVFFPNNSFNKKAGESKLMSTKFVDDNCFSGLTVLSILNHHNNEANMTITDFAKHQKRVREIYFTILIVSTCNSVYT